MLRAQGQFLSPEHVEQMQQSVSSLSSESLQFLMTEMREVSRLADDGGVCRRVYVWNLVKAFVDYQWLECRQEPNLTWALKSFRTEDNRLDVDEVQEVLIHIVDHVVRRVDQRGADACLASGPGPNVVCRAVGRSLSDVLGAFGDRFTLLVALKKETCFAKERWEQLSELFLGEWQASLDRSNDKITAHKEYRERVLSPYASEFDARLWNLTAEVLFNDYLTKEGRQTQARLWVESGEVSRLPDDIAKTVLEWASLSVKFAPKDKVSEELAQKIEESGARELAGGLARLDLRRAICAVASGAGAKVSWEKVDQATYSEFIVELLPLLRSVRATPEQYGRMLLSAIDTEFLDTFMEAYIDYLRRQLRSDYVDIAFWIWPTTDESDTLEAFVRSQRETVLDTLASRYCIQAQESRPIFLGWAWCALQEKEALDQNELDAFRERCDRVSTRSNWLNRFLRTHR